MLLSFATTVIAAMVTYLSATDGTPDETAASGAKVRRRCTPSKPKNSVFDKIVFIR